jgi:hypothetical protein
MGNINRRIAVQSYTGINSRPYPKNNFKKVNRACGVGGHLCGSSGRASV